MYSILKKSIFKNELLHSYLESCAHGLVIVLTTYFVLPRCTFGQGYLYNNATENTIILLQLVFTPVLRWLLFREKLLKVSESLAAFGLNLLLYCAGVSLAALLRGQPVLPQFYLLLLSYDCAVLVVNSLLFNIAVSYIVKAVLTKHSLKLVHISSQLGSLC